MIEYLAIILLGVAAGVFTGLVPGIHPNTVIFTSIPFYFYSGIGFLIYMCFIAGLSVSHTFHDFLPAIFLSAPEAEAALSSIPGTEMAEEGRGLEAFYYTVIGGASSILVFLLLVPIVFLALKPFYSVIEPLMGYILLFFLVVILLDSDNLLATLPVAVLAGALGLLSFSTPVNQQYVLLPVFTGLFAVPAMVRTLENRSSLPDQLKPEVDFEKGFRGGVLGFIAGMVAGIFPGLGAAVSTSFLAPLMDDSEKEFLAGMGGVNTTDIVVSFIAVLLIGKARSGASVALKSLSSVGPPQMFFLLGASLIGAAVSIPLALRVSTFFVDVVEKVDLKIALSAVLLVIISSTFYLTGLIGLVVLFTASFIGYASILAGDRRVCMAVLLVPSILFFSGGGIFI